MHAAISPIVIRSVRLLFLAFLWGLVLQAQPAPQPATITGRLSGSVCNAATKQFLEGALVELIGTGSQVRTDAAGRFTFDFAPAGEHRITASYTGLDSEEKAVRVVPDRDVLLHFELQSVVYLLETFVITGEREGNAASITRQRSAANVKSVVALDAFGNLGNENPGELLSRLSGVAPNISDEGDVFSVYVRGIDPTLNSVSIDGNKMATSGALSREFRFLNISAGAFEELEVVKAPTPDMDPDSLGGAVNMKTKSPLGMSERRRFSYRMGAKWAPPFLWNQTPTRELHRTHPITSFGYQEVFDAFGGQRNLGLALNAFYIENPTTYGSTLRDYAYTLNDPAYIWEYRTNDAYNLRKQRSVTLKATYQLTTATRLSLGAMGADAFENLKVNYQTRASTARSVATLNSSGQPTGSGAILPNYSATVTEARPLSSSLFETTTSTNAFMDRTRRLQLELSDKRGRLQTEAGLSYSSSRVQLSSGQDGSPGGGGSFVASVRSVGWRVDATESLDYPRFTQTAGPSILDMSSYGSGQLTQLNGTRKGEVYVASLDLRYDIGLEQRTWLKAGARWRSQESGETNGSSRYTYVGADGLSGTADDDLTAFQIPGLRRSGEYGLGPVPFVYTSSVAADVEKNPGRWREDVYYRESSRFSGSRKVTEEVTATYFMGNTRLGRLNVLSGARIERTDVAGEGHAMRLALPAIADPVARAAAEYGTRRRITGNYTDVFPGLHLTYAITSRFVARVSLTTSIGRPAFSNLVPNEQVDVANQEIEISNPSLKPQYGKNVDLSLEYYFEPVGLVSLGAFQKNLSDFIFNDESRTVGTGTDNGYGGQYAGYQIITKANGGDAHIQGLEATFQQELSFLPDRMRGFSVFANYTYLTTEGNYGGATQRTSEQVARFVPRSANAGLSYKRDRFSSRVFVNHVGEHLYSYSNDPSRLRYKMARTLTNLSLNYALRRGFTLNCDLNNLFQEPQRYYLGAGKPGRLQAYIDNGPSISLGISGAF